MQVIFKKEVWTIHIIYLIHMTILRLFMIIKFLRYDIHLKINLKRVIAHGIFFINTLFWLSSFSPLHYKHIVSFPWVIEILDWCPVGSVLPHRGKGASLGLVGHPSSDGVTIKTPYGVDVLLHWQASHSIFSCWVG